MTFVCEYVKEFLNCNENMDFLDQIKNCKSFEVYLIPCSRSDSVLVIH